MAIATACCFIIGEFVYFNHLLRQAIALRDETIDRIDQALGECEGSILLL